MVEENKDFNGCFFFFFCRLLDLFKGPRTLLQTRGEGSQQRE